MVEHHLPSSSSGHLLRLVVMVERKPTYQFQLQCAQNITCGHLLDELQKIYFPTAAQKPLFQDSNCSQPLTRDGNVTKTQQCYFNLTFPEYEEQIRKQFSKEQTVKTPIKTSKYVEEEISYENKVAAETPVTKVEAPSPLPPSPFQKKEPQTFVFQPRKEENNTYVQPIIPKKQKSSFNPESSNESGFMLKVQPVQTYQPAITPLEQTNSYERVPVASSGQSECCNLI